MNIPQAIDLFRTKRHLLAGIFIILTALGLIGIQHFLKIEENINAFVPSNDPELQKQYSLLNQAPFSHKILISLTLDETTPNTPKLIKIAGLLKSKFHPPWIRDTISGIDENEARSIFMRLYNSIPALADSETLNQIDAQLRPDTVHEQIQTNRRLLMSPEGLFLKPMILEDPLNLRSIVEARLKALSVSKDLKWVDGFLFDTTERHLLLMLETDISITDSLGSEQLIAHIESSIQTLQKKFEFKAEVLSAHAYTVANARTIKADMNKVIIGSTLGLIAIFALFIRQWKIGLLLLAAPAFSLVAAVLACSLYYPTVSAVTIGFGAVLLGISIDYALHVFFHLSVEKADVHQTLKSLIGPLTISSLTTLCAMSVLLFSDLQAQQQLALFSASGLIAAYIFSLILLPPFVKPRIGYTDTIAQTHFFHFTPTIRKLIGAIWLSLIILSLGPILQLHFEGNTRNLYIVTPQLKEAEEHIQSTWGQIRNRMMIIAEGADLQQALEVNDAVQKCLKDTPNLNPLSLASVLPSITTQTQNADQWKHFWQGSGMKRAEQLLTQEGWPIALQSKWQEKINRPSDLITLENIESGSIKKLLMDLIVPLKESTAVVTMVEANAEDTVALRGKLPNGASLVSQSDLARSLAHVTGRDFKRFALFVLFLNSILVWLIYRNLRRTFCALIPVISGLCGMFGCLQAMGYAINIFHVASALLVIGLSIDYGIFMSQEKPVGRATRQAVFISGLTTLAGFSALLLSHHPALLSIGSSVCLGIFFSILSALIVVPAFRETSMEKATHE
jgi:predicted exporter